MEGEIVHRDLVGDFMFPEYIALDHSGLTDLGNIRNILGHDGIAVVCFTIFGEKADEALEMDLVDNALDKGEGLTEKAGMVSS